MILLVTYLFTHSLTPHVHPFGQHLFSKWGLTNSFSMHSICIKHTYEVVHSDKFDMVFLELKNIKSHFKDYQIICTMAVSITLSVFPPHPTSTFPYLA